MNNQTDQRREAFVVKIGERFFYRSTKQRVLTSFSLAGAELFLTLEVAVRVQLHMRARGKKADIFKIQIQEE